MLQYQFGSVLLLIDENWHGYWVVNESKTNLLLKNENRCKEY